MNDKVWLVTGSSSGLGRAITTSALAAGQRVVATARNLADLDGLGPSDHCHTLSLDLTHPNRILQVVEAATRHWGSLDVIVNNAGYGLLGAVEECDDEQIRRNLETNFFGPLNVIKAALPQLRAQRSGHIVNISAAAAISNYPGLGIYGAAKAALDSVSESLRLELAPLGIHVTTVHPGPFRTNFIRRGIECTTSKIDGYQRSAGKFAQFLASFDGKQPGSPALAGEAIVRMVLEGLAPPYFPLGKYMIKKLRDKATALTRAADQWETMASSVDSAT